VNNVNGMTSQILYGIDEGNMFDVIKKDPNARTVEFWARYCESPVVDMLQGPDAKDDIDGQLRHLELTATYFAKWNASSLGGFAYLSQHAPTAAQRDKCMKAFKEYIAFVVAKKNILRFVMRQQRRGAHRGRRKRFFHAPESISNVFYRFRIGRMEIRCFWFPFENGCCRCCC
jgi:hypothetical protein